MAPDILWSLAFCGLLAALLFRNRAVRMALILVSLTAILFIKAGGTL